MSASTPIRRRVRHAAIAGVAALALVASAACDTADAANQPQPPQKGGTLRVIVSVLPEHLDPQKISAALDANISRLINRTLTTVKSEDGPGASEIVGDLATDTGRPSDGNRVWEFTLKQGLRWNDGTLITCDHVKYGVERNFSGLFTSGLQYPKQLLQDNPEPYKGPFLGSNEGLDSVTCVDQRTIRFRLQQAMGDFGYAVALPVFAPVPRDKDSNREAYDRTPATSGPYKVAQSDDKHVLLDRNPHWNQSTDGVRKAFPDQIDLVLDKNVPQVTNSLIQDQGEARNTVMLDVDIAPNFVQQIVNDEDLSKRLIEGEYSGVRYFAINMARNPDIRCRQALVFAVNKRKFRSAMGGSMFGALATSIISPRLRAHRSFDLYNVASKPEGDRDRALALMEEARVAGKPCKDRVTLAYPDNPVRRRLVQTVVESFQRIGIATELKPVVPPVDYFDQAIGDPKNQYDVMWAGWIADWANGSAVIPPLFSGKVIPRAEGATGNKNFSLLADPEIDRLIDEAMAEADLDAQYRLWGELDERIQQQAPIIPMLYNNALRYAGSNVRGGYIHPAFGQPDLCAIGLGGA